MLDKDVIYLSASTDAVDASLLTKDLALKQFCSEHEIDLSQVAGFGDSINDISFLEIPELGLVGAPSNAQLPVKAFLSEKDRAFISSKSIFQGFMDFYQKCIDRHILHIFTDKDGVLVWSEEGTDKDDLHNLFFKMGLSGNPFVIVLTGSSYEQNITFFDYYGLNQSLCENPNILKNPYIIYAENGAVQINVLDRSVRDFSEFLNPELVDVLINVFRREVTKRIESSILNSFDLGWSSVHSDQTSKIFIPNKRTMVTFDIPKQHKNYIDFRSTECATQLGKAILQEMIAVAEELSFPYKILG